MIEVSGTAQRLSGTISNNYGYMGIIVAALANGSPLGVLFAGFLLAVLLNAGIVLQTSGLSVSAMLAINGVILIFAAIGEVATQYQLSRERIEESIDLQPESRPVANTRADPLLAANPDAHSVTHPEEPKS